MINHTLVYINIYFFSLLERRQNLHGRKKKRERIYKCTLTLYISFSRTKPLPSPPGYHPKKQLGIVVIVLSSLFSDGLQSGRIGGLMWGYDGGWSHLNPRIQFSILFSHCGCLQEFHRVMTGSESEVWDQTRDLQASTQNAKHLKQRARILWGWWWWLSLLTSCCEGRKERCLL